MSKKVLFYNIFQFQSAFSKCYKKRCLFSAIIIIMLSKIITVNSLHLGRFATGPIGT